MKEKMGKNNPMKSNSASPKSDSNGVSRDGPKKVTEVDLFSVPSSSSASNAR